ncbi:MAG: hypothetical protein U0U70_00650 [Chitinophagaceae bacterium]
MAGDKNHNAGIVLKLQEIIQRKQTTIQLGKLSGEIKIGKETLCKMLESVMPKATINSDVSMDNIRVLIKKFKGGIIPQKENEPTQKKKKFKQFIKEISTPMEINRKKH